MDLKVVSRYISLLDEAITMVGCANTGQERLCALELYDTVLSAIRSTGISEETDETGEKGYYFDGMFLSTSHLDDEEEKDGELEGGGKEEKPDNGADEASDEAASTDKPASEAGKAAERMPDMTVSEMAREGIRYATVSASPGGVQLKILIYPIENNSFVLVLKKGTVLYSGDGLFEFTISGVPVSVRCTEDGDILMVQMTAKGETAIERAEYKGKEGHPIICDTGVAVHVLPLSFSNNDDGQARFAYCIITKDGAKPYAASDEKTFAFEGRIVRVNAVWENDVIKAEVVGIDE